MKPFRANPLMACFALAWLVVAVSVAMAQRAAPAPPPRMVSAGQAVIMLYKEAPDAVRDKPPLSLAEQFDSRPAPRPPESACDFAQRRNLIARNDDVAGVVLRRLNADDTAIDSYVRWQLLSFNPKFDGLIDPRSMRTILAALPQFVAQPQYIPPPPVPQGSPASITIATQKTVVVGQTPVPGTGGSRPKLAVVTSGVSMGNSGPPPPVAVDIDAVLAELADKRRKMALINKWVIQFRNALIPMLPEANGVRLTVMLQDVSDRLVAGDASWEAAVARLMAACEALPKPGTQSSQTALSMDLRRALAEQARQLGKIATPVTERLQLKSNGEVALDGFYVRFPPEQLQRMLTLLAGETAPTAAPAQPPAAVPAPAPPPAPPAAELPSATTQPEETLD